MLPVVQHAVESLDPRLQEPRRNWIMNIWEHVVMRPLVGKHRIPEAAGWVTVDEHSHLRFLERNGVLFEANQGAPPLSTNISSI